MYQHLTQVSSLFILPAEPYKDGIKVNWGNKSIQLLHTHTDKIKKVTSEENMYTKKKKRCR